MTLPDGREVFARLKPLNAANADDCTDAPGGVTAVEDADGFTLDNGLLRLRVDRGGRITSLRHGGRELVATSLNDWRLYNDVNPQYDAWEVSRTYERSEVRDAVRGTATLSRADAACVEIHIDYAFGHSRATQRMVLRAASPRVDFYTHVDWHERHRMLKVRFETNLLTDDILSETQFGYISRPAHASHPFAADRYEACQHRFSALCEENRGLAILNDGLYGIGAGRGLMSLTLLRAPLVPDETCDRGEHDFTYALYPFATSFALANVAAEAARLNQPVAVLPGRCVPAPAPWAEGLGAMLETLKPAGDGNGVILRLYQSLRASEVATLHLPRPMRVTPVRMDERAPLGETLCAADVPVSLRPFEIKTLRVEAP